MPFLHPAIFLLSSIATVSRYLCPISTDSSFCPPQGIFFVFFLYVSLNLFRCKVYDQNVPFSLVEYRFQAIEWMFFQTLEVETLYHLKKQQTGVRRSR